VSRRRTRRPGFRVTSPEPATLYRRVLGVPTEDAAGGDGAADADHRLGHRESRLIDEGSRQFRLPKMTARPPRTGTLQRGNPRKTV
jgi:hypothetical protein